MWLYETPTTGDKFLGLLAGSLQQSHQATDIHLNYIERISSSTASLHPYLGSSISTWLPRNDRHGWSLRGIECYYFHID